MAQFVKGMLELFSPPFFLPLLRPTSDKLQRSDADLEEKDAGEDTNKRVAGRSGSS